jgi:hypothetical protein
VRVDICTKTRRLVRVEVLDDAEQFVVRSLTAPGAQGVVEGVLYVYLRH